MLSSQARMLGEFLVERHVLSRDAMHNDRLWPYPQLDELAAAGMVVNQRGQRVVVGGIGDVAHEVDCGRIEPGILERDTGDRLVRPKVDPQPLHEAPPLADGLAHQRAFVEAFVGHPFAGHQNDRDLEKLGQARGPDREGGAHHQVSAATVRAPQFFFDREPLVETARHLLVHQERPVGQVA